MITLKYLSRLNKLLCPSVGDQAGKGKYSQGIPGLIILFSRKGLKWPRHSKILSTFRFKYARDINH